MEFRKAIKSVILLTWLATLGLLSSCIIVDEPGYGPPPHAHGYYEYYYYPSVDIYFDIRRRIYFYHTQHGWVKRRHLPRGYHLKRRGRVKLKMRHERPYVRHDEHRRRYHHPARPYKKHRRGRSWKERRDIDK